MSDTVETELIRAWFESIVLGNVAYHRYNPDGDRGEMNIEVSFHNFDPRLANLLSADRNIFSTRTKPNLFNKVATKLEKLNKLIRENRKLKKEKEKQEDWEERYKELFDRYMEIKNNNSILEQRRD